MVRRKQKVGGKSPEGEGSPKKMKPENDYETGDVGAEFDRFCKVMRENLSVEEMRIILEINEQNSSGTNEDVILRCLDMLFHGALDKCPICGGRLEWTGTKYACRGDYSEWSTCTFSTKDPPRREETIEIPESIQNKAVSDFIEDRNRKRRQRKRRMGTTDKLFAGMTIALSGRLSRTHQYWKSEIEKREGKVSNSVSGATSLVTTPAEGERGGSIKIADALERGIPIVSEAWLIDSIEKGEPQPLEDYDISRDLVVEARALLGDKEDTLESELKVYGKRGVHKDSKLQEEGGQIFEKDGILYNCAFSLCDLGREVNDFCVMQLIQVPDEGLHLYYKKGRAGDDIKRAEERLEEKEDDVDGSVKEFVKLFEELTGNEFEPWEREKLFQKKPRKFYPVDMDDGVDVRHGGLSFRQVGPAAVHCKLDPYVTSLMKVLCSQDTYRYAMMEMALDTPDLPLAMLTDVHLKRCEVVLLQFIETVRTMKEMGRKATAVWSDFSMKWFTLLQSTRPFIFRDYEDLAEHAAAVFESVRDMNVASRLIGDMSGPTLDDPLFDRYQKLGSLISPVDKRSEDYKMIVDYLERTYEPVKLGDISYGVSVENILAVESSACPSFEEIKKQPNKVLLWCGKELFFRYSELKYVKTLAQGTLASTMLASCPRIHGIHVAIAAEAARYGFTSVERPEGFLVLAIASLGERVTEFNRTPEAEEVKTLEEKAAGVKGLGRKKTDELEHFVWRDDIKVPRGRLVPSAHKDSPLEYNEYAVYDPKQVSIRFLVAVRYVEQDVVFEDVEPEADEI
ncbi:hypothetical protein RHGRI_036725 [Rhododendron griersonianum]|uniref:Poly [ADP-ribose] polymerase n=1 Tax=Rhododendron griersonianum TaxID=479676 RepID=A0AAV6HS67_9ERIC|nr:hypothetical protein RHGRI_036725 [Rhododendron griersonianum]